MEKFKAGIKRGHPNNHCSSVSATQQENVFK